MLKCCDVTRLASDWIDGELSFSDRCRVRLHLLLCRHCRSFVAGLEAGGNLIRRYGHRLPGTEVSEAFLGRLDQRIAQRLAHLDRPSLVPPAGEAVASQATSHLPFLNGVNDPQDHKVQRIFAEIEAREGMVPNLYRAYAHNPDILEHNWNRVKSLMYDGQLSLLLKNAIAAAVSQDNGCEYCVRYHAAMMQTLGMRPEEVTALLHQDQTPGLSDQDAALFHLARESNRDPHGTSMDLVEQARAAGASEAGLIEALGVMELYCSFNKFLDTLKIPLDKAANH